MNPSGTFPSVSYKTEGRKEKGTYVPHLIVVAIIGQRQLRPNEQLRQTGLV